MDSIFNRNLELAINKNEYMLVYPNINNIQNNLVKQYKSIIFTHE